MNDRKKPTGDALRSYVIDNIDRAVDEGWIRVWYQPVVRTLTGEICGMEALARWEDPVYGLLNPDEFIPPLEQAKLIHKLDSCVIRQICRNYAGTMAKTKQTVAVSFNISRLDFALCDIHQVIEDAIRENKVPREAFRVEITESMMEAAETRLQEEIEHFWDRGLRVWMDDFGSGYSSLNVLKDYHFETLKIDMIFLSNFNARSQEIVKSVVDMAKRIGVHTLAEGVETKEQLEFLKSIGCEQAQGYFIGRPMPHRESHEYLKKHGFVLENPVKRQYYHDIGRINVLSATPMQFVRDNETESVYREGQIPLAMIEYANGDLRYLFANKSYMTTLEHLGIHALSQIEEEFKNPHSTLRGKFLAMILKAIETDSVQAIDFVRADSHCYAQVRRIAGFPGGDAFLCILQNLSEDRLIDKAAHLTDYLHSLCTIYDRIELIDMKTGMSQNLYRSAQTIRDYNQIPAQEELRLYAKEEIYPEDRDRFHAFADLETLEKRIDESDYHYVSAPFRTRIGSGTFIWTLYAFLYAGEPGERMILSCYRRLAPDVLKYARGMMRADLTSSGKNSENIFSPELLWKNFTLYSDTAFFWKDRSRRFVGANQQFLNYFGLESVSEIIGRTDEEIGWHVDPEPIRVDEERILSFGEQTFLVPGTVIRKGEIRGIIASKMPIYRDGEIVGLMGYFLDVTDLQEQGGSADALSRKDPLTGSLSLMGMVEAVLRFQDSFVFKGTDFAIMVFDIDHFHFFTQDYGREWCNHLLQEVSRRIRTATGTKDVTGRMNGDQFVIVRQFEDRKELDETVKKVIKKIESIREIDDIPCTIYMAGAYSVYSEVKNLQKMFSDAEEAVSAQKPHRNP
ncbi:MAG: EAL domain-containing protein [Lachnospiraceae bacterium]|nr:EAL domain-containing protein [Lachnospiraceae bacterium]